MHRHAEAGKSPYLLQLPVYCSSHLFLFDVLLASFICMQCLRKTEHSGCEVSWPRACFDKACHRGPGSIQSSEEPLLIKSDSFPFLGNAQRVPTETPCAKSPSSGSCSIRFSSALQRFIKSTENTFANGKEKKQTVKQNIRQSGYVPRHFLTIL